MHHLNISRKQHNKFVNIYKISQTLYYTYMKKTLPGQENTTESYIPYYSVIILSFLSCCLYTVRIHMTYSFMTCICRIAKYHISHYDERIQPCTENKITEKQVLDKRTFEFHFSNAQTEKILTALDTHSNAE